MDSVAPATIKWIGRVRAGCLATRARLFGHANMVDSLKCLCCGAESEDEVHAVACCPATGTAD